MRIFNKYIASATAAAALLLSACNGDYAQPPVPVPEGGIESIGNGEWDNPLSVYQARIGTIVQESAISEETGETYTREREESWVTGYIVGWIDINVSNIMKEETARFDIPSTVPTNIIMAADPDETDWEKCISVQLPSGPVRSALNLKDNPGNKGKEVTIYGTTGSKYCSVYGVRSVSDFKFGPVGNEPAPVIPPGPVMPEGDLTFRKATSIEAGGIYAFVADGRAALNLPTDAGYVDTEQVSVSGDVFKTANKNVAFSIAEADGGYYIVQSSDSKYFSGRKLMETVNLLSSPDENAVFTISLADGVVTVTNVTNSKVFSFKSQFNQFGLYNSGAAALPTLYRLAE